MPIHGEISRVVSRSITPCLLMLFLAASKGTFSSYWGEYNTTAGPVDGKINVHLVPHTQ